MFIGIDLANQPAFGDPTALSLAASAAEQVGYASVWVPAVTPGDDERPAAVAAAATDRIRVGVALDDGYTTDTTDHLLALEDLVGDRLVVAVPMGTRMQHAHFRHAVVLIADLPRADAAPGTAGWSPRQPSVGELVDVQGLLVPRVCARMTANPSGARRDDWHGSLVQVAGDVAAALECGATEVVVGLHDRPAFDEALERWALLAEAVEVAAWE